jgi:hypothetical protein
VEYRKRKRPGQGEKGRKRMAKTSLRKIFFLDNLTKKDHYPEKEGGRL